MIGSLLSIKAALVGFAAPALALLAVSIMQEIPGIPQVPDSLIGVFQWLITMAAIVITLFGRHVLNRHAEEIKRATLEVAKADERALRAQRNEAAWQGYALHLASTVIRYLPDNVNIPPPPSPGGG